MKRNILLLLVALLPMVANAYDVCIDGIYYNFSGIGASVTYGEIDYSGPVVIPNSVSYNGKTYSVTSIGNEAFSSCTRLTSITIPNSVKSISFLAFGDCIGLTSIVIGSGMTSIGDYAFSGCSNLTSITIPKSVTSIGTCAFSGCASLASIIVESGNRYYDSRNNCNAIIETATNTLISGCKNTTISNSVTSIGYYAFSGCTSLTSVTIPNSVTRISPNAFEKCTSLASLSIPGSVTLIEYEAFSGCSALIDVKCYAKNVPSTNSTSFNYTPILSATLHVPEGSLGAYKTTMPWRRFGTIVAIKENNINFADANVKALCIANWDTNGDDELSEAEAAAVTNLGTVFQGNMVINSFDELQYFTGLTSIVQQAFYGCSSLTSITIPESVTSISSNSFSGCSRLATVTIKSKTIVSASRTSSTSMKIFFGNQVKNYILGGDVDSIGDYAFYGCTSLTSITIPNSVTSIGYHAFDGCSSLTSVTIPNSVTSIGGSAFYGCTGLASITIPNSVTSIGAYAFYDCSSLTSITIPNSVLHIGYRVFDEYLTIYISNDKNLLLTLWSIGYENIKETETGRSLPVPKMSLVATTASSLTVSFVNPYTELTEIVMVSGSPLEKKENGHEMKLTGLRPNKAYDFSTALTCEGTTYERIYSFLTDPLTLTTQQPKVINAGNVIVAAESNLDDEETNVGFEWRRTDWPDDFTSNTGVAYLYEGKMEGYIRNLYTEKLWRYRPYYESDSGNRYYGDWVGIDPTNTSYFEPTVHTYAQINVTGNRAEVKGYAMRGTDNVQSQGFMYWQNNTSVSLRRRAASVPSGATVVNASGNIMTATLEDLEYEATYNYVAFVTTSEGETFYGEMQTFTTSFDPDGIEEVKSSEEATEVARYDLQGRMIAKPQKGINIIRYSDGTSKKVLVK